MGSGDESTLKREHDGEEDPETSEPPTKVAKTNGRETSEDQPERAENETNGAPADGVEKGNPEDPKTEATADAAAATAEGSEPPVAPTNAGGAEEAPEAGADEAAANAPEGSGTEPTQPEEAAKTAPAPAEVAQPSTNPGLPPGVPAPDSTPVDPAKPATETPDSMVEERAELESCYVGRVIGKGGEMIRDLQARSGSRIDVDQNVPPGAPRIITYRGTRKAVDFAKQLVTTLCDDEIKESELPLGMAARKQLIVPSSSVGKIIGRGGEMIRELQARSKAKIQVDHSGAGVVDPSTRQVTITGTEEAVIKAEEMIMFLVANPGMDASEALSMLVEDKQRTGLAWGTGPPYPNLPNSGKGMIGHTGYGGGAAYAAQQQSGYQSGGGYNGYSSSGGREAEVFHASKNFMGRIIGSRGITINDLQKRSGCDIQINQDVPPGQDCEITIKGSRQGIEMVKGMIRDIIELGPNHPFAGGLGQQQGGYGGGGYQQGPPGGQMPPAQSYGGYQQPAPQPQYGQTYNAPPYQGGPSGYGHPEMPPYQAQLPPHQQYGMPQQQYGMPQHGMPPQQHYGGGGGYSQPPMQQQQAPAPGTWRTATTADGQTYYYNEKTGETQWDKPMGM